MRDEALISAAQRVEHYEMAGRNGAHLCRALGQTTIGAAAGAHAGRGKERRSQIDRVFQHGASPGAARSRLPEGRAACSSKTLRAPSLGVIKAGREGLVRRTARPGIGCDCSHDPLTRPAYLAPRISIRVFQGEDPMRLVIERLPDLRALYIKQLGRISPPRE